MMDVGIWGEKRVAFDSVRFGIGATRLYCELCEQHGWDGTVYAAGRGCRQDDWEYPDSPEECYRFARGLFNRKHMKPFEFPSVIVGFRVPIFVARQIRTYQNTAIERSARACEPMEFNDKFLPPPEDPIFPITVDALEKYTALIQQGWKRQEARRVWTVDFLTKVYHRIHVRQAFDMFDERLDAAAQGETQNVIKSFYKIVKHCFPVLMQVYEESKGDEWKAKFLAETTTEKMIV